MDRRKLRYKVIRQCRTLSPLQEMIDYNVNTDRNKTQIHYKVIRQCRTLSPLQEMIDYSVNTDTNKIQIQIQSDQAKLDIITTATPQRND